jgi:hypothetical protein
MTSHERKDTWASGTNYESYVGRWSRLVARQFLTWLDVPSGALWSQPSKALSEMIRAVRIGGTVAAFVWDYAGQMQLMRYFWDSTVALDGALSALDEGQRFPLCQPEPLRRLFQTANLGKAEVHLIDVATNFRDLHDYWSHF